MTFIEITNSCVKLLNRECCHFDSELPVESAYRVPNARASRSAVNCTDVGGFWRL